jgi:hypothetical protein
LAPPKAHSDTRLRDGARHSNLDVERSKASAPRFRHHAALRICQLTVPAHLRRSPTRLVITSDPKNKKAFWASPQKASNYEN